MGYNKFIYMDFLLKLKMKVDLKVKIYRLKFWN